MALYQEQISDNGIISKYHKISNISLRDKKIICHVDSYTNKEYRDNN